MKFKNRKFKGGKQSGLDKMKAKTLGKKKRRWVRGWFDV